MLNYSTQKCQLEKMYIMIQVEGHVQVFGSRSFLDLMSKLEKS